VTVYERNAPDDTFGFGVVFLRRDARRVRGRRSRVLRRDHAALSRGGAEIDVHYRGEVVHLGRPRLLGARAGRPARGPAAQGPRRSTSTCASAPSSTAAGLEEQFRPRRRRRTASTRPLRRRHAEAFRPSLDRRQGEVRLVRDRPRLRRVHVLHPRDRARRPAGPRLSLQRLDEHVHRGDDRGGVARPRGSTPATEEESLGALRGPLRGRPRRPPADRQPLACGSTSSRSRNASWRHENVVLPRRRRGTPAHFSIGSGTKLAMEDAIGLAWACQGETRNDVEGRDRRPTRPSAGRSSNPPSAPPRAASSWFEGHRALHGARTLGSFAFNLLTPLRGGSPTPSSSSATRGFVASVDAQFLAGPPADVHAVPPARRPSSPNRVVRLPDGHVLLGRRHTGRLPPRAPRAARGDRRAPAS